MNAAILQQLTDVMRDVFDNPDLEITPATSAADVEEWDSVNHIMLVVQIEREFGVKFQTAELEDMKNIGDLVALIEGKQGAR